MNTVTYTTALALKEAGWDKQTERAYDPHGRLCTSNNQKFYDVALPPAPSFSEIWLELPGNTESWRLDLNRISISYVNHKTDFAYMEFLHDHDNITEAAAQLWLQLSSEGVI